MSEGHTWPGGVAMETAIWKDGTGSCDSMLSMTSTHSDDSLDYFTPDVRATLMFLEATIDSLDVEEEEDSGLSTDELETHSQTMPHSSTLPDKVVNICMPSHARLEDVSRYHDDPNQVKGRDHKPSLSYMVPTPLLLANGASFLRPRSTSSAAEHKRQPASEPRTSATEPPQPQPAPTPEPRPSVTDAHTPAPETTPSVPELQLAVPEPQPSVLDPHPAAPSITEAHPCQQGSCDPVTEPATPMPPPTHETEIPVNSNDATETPSESSTDKLTIDPSEVPSEVITGATENASVGPVAALEKSVTTELNTGDILAPENTDMATNASDANTSDPVESTPVKPADYPVTVPDPTGRQDLESPPERLPEGCSEVGAEEPSGESVESSPTPLVLPQSSEPAPLDSGLAFIPPPMAFMDEPTEDSEIPEASEIPEPPEILEPSEIPEASTTVTPSDVSPTPLPDAPVQVSTDADTGFPASDIPEPFIPAPDVPVQTSADKAFPVSEIPAPVIPAVDVPAQNSLDTSFPVSDIPAPVISSPDIPSLSTSDAAFPPSDIPPPVIPPSNTTTEVIPDCESQPSDVPDLVTTPSEIPAPDIPADIIPCPDLPVCPPQFTDSPDESADTVCPTVKSSEDSRPATTLPVPVPPLIKSAEDAPPTTPPLNPSDCVPVPVSSSLKTAQGNVPATPPPDPVSPSLTSLPEPVPTPAPTPQSLPVPTTPPSAQRVPVPTTPPASQRGPLTYSELQKLKKVASMKKPPGAIPVVQVRRTQPAAVADVSPPATIARHGEQQQGDPKSPPAVAPKPKKLPPNISLKGGTVHMDPKKVHMEALRKLGLLKSSDADPNPGPASSAAAGPSLSPRSRRSWAPPQSPLTSPVAGSSCAGGPTTPEINPQLTSAPAFVPLAQTPTPEAPSPPQISPAPPRKTMDVCVPASPSGVEGDDEDEDRLDVPDHLPPSPPSTPTPPSSDSSSNNNNPATAPRCHGISVQISPLSDAGERRAALRRLGLGQD